MNELDKIQRKHLSFFDDAQSKRSVTVQTETSETKEEYATMGEAMNPGTAVYYASDGKVYKAGTEPADRIAIDGGDANSKTRITKLIRVEVQDASFDTGEETFLINSTPNITTTKPEPETGIIIQKLGKAVSSDEIMPNISVGYIVE